LRQTDGRQPTPTAAIRPTPPPHALSPGGPVYALVALWATLRAEGAARPSPGSPRRRVLITMGDVLTFSDDEDFLVGEVDEEGASCAPSGICAKCCCSLLRMHRAATDVSRIQTHSRTGRERIDRRQRGDRNIDACGQPTAHDDGPWTTPWPARVIHTCRCPRVRQPAGS